MREYSDSTPRMFSRSHRATSDLFPRAILERNFNHKRKVKFYNAAETFAKDGIGNARSLRQDEKFAF